MVGASEDQENITTAILPITFFPLIIQHLS